MFTDWFVVWCYLPPIVLGDKELRRVCQQAAQYTKDLKKNNNNLCMTLVIWEKNYRWGEGVRVQRRKERICIYILTGSSEICLLWGLCTCSPLRHVTFKHLSTWAWAPCLWDYGKILSSLYVKTRFWDKSQAMNAADSFSVIVAGREADRDGRAQLDESLMSFSSIDWIPNTTKANNFWRGFLLWGVYIYYIKSLGDFYFIFFFWGDSLMYFVNSNYIARLLLWVKKKPLSHFPALKRD